MWSAAKVNNNIIFNYKNDEGAITLYQVELFKMLSTLTDVNVIVKCNLIDYIFFKHQYKKSLNIISVAFLTVIGPYILDKALCHIYGYVKKLARL